MTTIAAAAQLPSTPGPESNLAHGARWKIHYLLVRKTHNHQLQQTTSSGASRSGSKSAHKTHHLIIVPR